MFFLVGSALLKYRPCRLLNRDSPPPALPADEADGDIYAVHLDRPGLAPCVTVEIEPAIGSRQILCARRDRRFFAHDRDASQQVKHLPSVRWRSSARTTLAWQAGQLILGVATIAFGTGSGEMAGKPLPTRRRVEPRPQKTGSLP